MRFQARDHGHTNERDILASQGRKLLSTKALASAVAAGAAFGVAGIAATPAMADASYHQWGPGPYCLGPGSNAYGPVIETPVMFSGHVAMSAYASAKSACDSKPNPTKGFGCAFQSHNINHGPWTRTSYVCTTVAGQSTDFYATYNTSNEYVRPDIRDAMGNTRPHWTYGHSANSF
jgi:hypothetical protein